MKGGGGVRGEGKREGACVPSFLPFSPVGQVLDEAEEAGRTERERERDRPEAVRE